MYKFSTETGFEVLIPEDQKFHVKGRGDVYTFELGTTINRNEIWAFLGHACVINGEPFFILAFEMFAVQMCSKVGALVRPAVAHNCDVHPNTPTPVGHCNVCGRMVENRHWQEAETQ